MTPLGAILTIALCAMVFSLSRTTAAAVIIAAVCYITQGQELHIGFHFTSVRLVLLAGFIRATTRGEMREISMNAVDKALIVYAFCIFIISLIRVPSVDEFVYQLGTLYNVFLAYFVFRSLIKNEADIVRVLALSVLVMAPLAVVMVREAMSGSNAFAMFGGVGAFSMVRDGNVRAEGPFRSPITAGSLGATFAMLYAAMYFARVHRKLAVVGLLASFTIVSCAHSSGPILGALLGVAALACWGVRNHTRRIRWGIVITLTALNLVMKAPVWFLLGRISDVVGGGGYHRAYLIDHFVTGAGSWFFFGTNQTGDWEATQLPEGGADLTNQFVSDGVNGGILGLVTSILLVVRCFQRIGTALRSTGGSDPVREKFVWGLGATLVGSIGILFSVTYFDQMHVIWYFLIACIAGISVASPEPVEDVLEPIAVDQETDAEPVIGTESEVPV